MILKNEVFQFNIGNFQCTAVSDGTYTYPDPIPLLFPNAPKEHLAQILQKYESEPGKWNEFVSSYTCLTVNTGEHLLLIDTGAGNLGPDTGKLLKNLEAQGVSPEKIDTVILTHGHPDHIGGNTNDDGEPAFPDARYIMLKDEWDFWTTGEADSEMVKAGIDQETREVLLEFSQNNLLPIQNQVELIKHGTEIVPGIQAVGLPGHTPGLMMPLISSGNQQLLYTSDTVVHPIHLEQPEWSLAVDLIPRQAAASRYKLIQMAAKENTLLFAFHFPFPGLGYIARRGDTWHWNSAAEI